jgi:hypothetical protein
MHFSLRVIDMTVAALAAIAGAAPLLGLLTSWREMKELTLGDGAGDVRFQQRPQPSKLMSWFHTTNCTTSVLFHTRMNPESPPMSWKVLLSGYVPDYLYDLGKIDTTRPFPELEKLSHVNARGHAADKDPAFSQRIRERPPKPPAAS